MYDWTCGPYPQKTCTQAWGYGFWWVWVRVWKITQGLPEFRDCQEFLNSHGFWVGYTKGTGMGWVSIPWLNPYPQGRSAGTLQVFLRGFFICKLQLVIYNIKFTNYRLQYKVVAGWGEPTNEPQGLVSGWVVVVGWEKPANEPLWLTLGAHRC